MKGPCVATIIAIYRYFILTLLVAERQGSPFERECAGLKGAGGLRHGAGSTGYD